MKSTGPTEEGEGCNGMFKSESTTTIVPCMGKIVPECHKNNTKGH